MTSDTIAVIDDDRSYTFSEISNFIAGTAKYLLNNEIKPQENISILSDNSLGYVITIFALWKIGSIPVPINTRLRDEEIQSLLDSADCSRIIKSNDFKESIPTFPAIEMKIESSSEIMEYRNHTILNETAVIIHTSGSSGKPKGVEITNNNLFKSYLSETSKFDYSHDDYFLASLPFYHIGGFAIISRALLSGGTLVIPRSLKQNDIVDSIRINDPSIISFVPTVLNRLIDRGILPNKKLRYLFLGGGASSDNLIHSAIKKKWPVVKVFGSTETTAMITACYGEELQEHPSSAGKPLENVEIKILDEGKNELEVDTIGEISVKSPSIAKGYFRSEKKWNEKIHNDYYLTGDHGFLDRENRLFVVSRRTDLIISGGENIDPREIESVINEHTDIVESFVFPIKDEEWGELAAALISLKDNSSLENDDIKKYLKLKLASFKIPKAIKIVNEIPKTELGKVNLEEVKRIFDESNI